MIFDHAAKTIWIRQSWLDNAIRCPERGRFAVTLPQYDDADSDSTFTGTTVHYAIEQYLRGAVGLEDMPLVVEAYVEKNLPTDLEWKKMDGPADIVFNARNDVAAFAEHIAPLVPRGGRCEQSFAVPLDLWHGDWRIGIKGTVDYCAPNGELWDWKTSSRKYSARDKQQLAVQPTQYALAAIKGGLGTDWQYELPLTFKYGVMEHMAKYARPQIVTVTRTQGHIDWLLAQIQQFVDLALNFGVERHWPRDDDHFLCNEKWCPWWSLCKGGHVAPHDLYAPQQIELTDTKPKTS